MSDTREGRLTTTFVALADTLVADYDVVDLLQTLVDSCAELVEARAVGLVLADEAGELAVMASTSEVSEIVALLQPPTGVGPTERAYSSGDVVSVPDLSAVSDWPEFSTSALALGFHSAHAVPMRLRKSTIGAVALFREQPGHLTTEDASIVRGLTDVATIGILHERAMRESDLAQQQLQFALDSRVIIEQAKGLIAYSHSVDMDSAFRMLRDYARGRGLNLRDVAELVVNRSISI